MLWRRCCGEEQRERPIGSLCRSRLIKKNPIWYKGWFFLWCCEIKFQTIFLSPSLCSFSGTLPHFLFCRWEPGIMLNRNVYPRAEKMRICSQINVAKIAHHCCVQGCLLFVFLFHVLPVTFWHVNVLRGSGAAQHRCALMWEIVLLERHRKLTFWFLVGGRLSSHMPSLLLEVW